jgi:uncharacterized membrane protein YesL
MSGILSPEGRVSSVLNTIGDLIILNLLTLVCSIPVFTIGAAFSSMYQILIKIARKEEGHIVGPYFKAFRENFRKSTIIWFIGGGISLFLAFDIFLLSKFSFSYSRIYQIILCIFFFLTVMFTLFALVTEAHFENTIKNIIVNGMKFSVIHIFLSVLVTALTIAPFLMLHLTLRLIPLFLLLGYSGPGYVCGLYFSDLFSRYEKENAEQ